MTVLAVLWRIASVTVPIPIAFMVGTVVWWQLDKGSAVRRAVAEMVASNELEAERAKVAVAERVRQEVEKQRDALAAATKEFEADALAAKVEADQAQSELDEMRRRPPPAHCAVDDDLLGRLRNR